jgi:hypothetical protein
LEQLRPIKHGTGSIAEGEDAYLSPIRRTFNGTVRPLIYSALDHLELVEEALNSRTRPHPFAESTSIRTAITAASTALWIQQDDRTERRRRTLEFLYRDCEGFIGFLRTLKNQQGMPPEASPDLEWRINGTRGYQDWIITRLKELVPDEPNSGDDRDAFWKRLQNLSLNEPISAAFRKSFWNGLTKDTDIVRAAASALKSGLPTDPKARLLGTWRSLSGRAHGMLWPTVPGYVQHGGPDQLTGQINVSPHGNPDELLNASFMALWVVRAATEQWHKLCEPVEVYFRP